MKSLKHLLILLLTQLTLLSTPQGLQAQVDPAIEWKEIETEDAYWIFDAKHQAVAKHFIEQFKQAKQKVFPLFNEEPRKMTIILRDHTDLANGAAQVSPHPIISLNLVNPSGDSAIGEFNNQILELLMHEYTHILNMEPVHGWMTPLKYIFGSVAHPNMILPRWYTEGLAVYTESRLSENGGRLNSQYAEGMARSLTLAKKWDEYPISDLNDNHPDWLGASRAYLFGGILWDNITREKGDEVINKMNQSYSRRIPYLLDGVAEYHTGYDYTQLLSKAYKTWEAGAQKQIDKVLEAPHMPGEIIDKGNGQHRSPKISPDGLWMAFYTNNKKGNGNINLTLRHHKKGFRSFKPQQVESNTKGQSLTWHPAATGFVFEKLEKYNHYNLYYDLYFYNLRTKKSMQLTKGLRAHHACFSPRGNKLFFLENRPGHKRIVMMDWVHKKTTILYTGKIGDDIRHLSCVGDESLLFVEHLVGTPPRIARINIESKQIDIEFDEYPVNYLTLSHKGALFTSAQSGIENIYLLNNENRGRPQALTNSLTRIQHAELDPLDDSLYFSQLTTDGLKLYYLKGAQWESLKDTPPTVTPIFKSFSRKPVTLAPTPENTSTLETEDFSPWRYLYPNHWIPFVYLVDGGTLWQAMTSAGDPLGINTLSLTAQWDTLTKKPGASLSYINQSTPVALGVGLSDFHSFFYSTRSNLHFTNATFLAGAKLRSLDDLSITFKWNYSALALTTTNFIRQGPQLEFSYDSNGAKLSRGKKDDISRGNGWRAKLGHKNYLADLGNTSYGETYSHLGTFWSSFTPKRHVFYLGVNGSYAPQVRSGFFAASTLAGPFYNPQITTTSFLQRGYPTGIFVARNLVNANAEYRMPLLDIFGGFKAPPLFFKNLQANFVFDATTLDGAYSSNLFKTSRATEIGRWFTGYGLELEANVNAGFHVPVNFTLGLYYGEEMESYGGFTTFFNVRL